jgi:MIP family channel proteins
MANLNLKALVAELIGTFALIFLGAGSGVVLGIEGSPAGLITVALAHGLTLMVFAYAYGHISGTHINPAVTIGLAVAGKFDWGKVVPYIIAQLVGAIIAGFTLLFVFGGPLNTLGATVINYDLTTVGGAFVLEMIATFFLVNTILNAAVSGRAGNLAPLAIGMTLAACIMFFGPVTGASLNPARTLGPAVAAGIYSDIWVYMVATVLGGVLAGLLYRAYFEDPVEAVAPAPPIAPPVTNRSAAAAPRPAGTSRRRR